MKKAIFFLTLVLTIGSCKNPDAIKKDIEQGTDIEKITKEESLHLLHTWTDAYLKKDLTLLSQVLDDTWVYSGSSDGKTSDKKSTINEFGNANYTFDDITYQDITVQLYDDVAVVRGAEEMVIVGELGDTTKVRLRFTDVYQKKNGVLKAISTHSSSIDNP